MRQLGVLKPVEPREVWRNEPEFSSWLKENIASLAKSLGLEVDLVLDREVEAGEFAADLAGKELTSGRKIVIENQLGATNHDHLGKVITYASNLDGGVVVWIAGEFRPEHRRALEWMNVHTDDAVRLFGVELRVLRVDDSDPAVEFRIVAEPAETDKPPQSLTVRQRAYLAFFTDLLTRLKKTRKGMTAANRAYPQSWFEVPAGKSGFRYVFSFAQNEQFRVELYIDVQNKDQNEAYLKALEAEAKAIDKAIGHQLSWEQLKERRACRIAAYTPGTIDSSDEDLEKLKVWALDMIGRFVEAFSERIRKLKPKQQAEADDEPVSATD
jgi:hypothetical protein